MDTTSATAMLVGTRDMLAAHPHAVTATIARGEIEEALSSELPAELILDVVRPAHGGAREESRTVTVAWDRADLESLLAGTDAEAMTFSFDRTELGRAFDEPDFEAHGLRETALVITVAAAAAIGASAASGMPYQDSGPSTASRTAVSAPAPDAFERAAARGSGAAAGHDEATLAGRGIDAAAAIPDAFERAAARGSGAAAGHDEATFAARGIDSGTGAVLTAGTAATPDAFERAAARGSDAGAGHDEATLVARGIVTPAAASHDEATLVARGIDTSAPAGDSGSGLEFPSLDAPSAVAVGGGLAVAGLLIASAAFAAGRNRIRPV